MSIRYIIIDDEPPARRIINEYLKDNSDFKLLTECNNGFDGFKAINELKPDLVFLDIQMPKLTGFEMLEILDEIPPLIFTTAYDQYALKAFEVNAIDYLLKPYSKERFFEALNKSSQKLASQNVSINKIQETVTELKGYTDRVVVKDGSEIHVIDIQSIIYIEAEDDYIMIHTLNGKYLKHGTMKQMEQTLPPELFIRVHRSFLVNVKMIRKIEKFDKETFMLLMEKQHKIRTSKAGSKELKDKFIER